MTPPRLGRCSTLIMICCTSWMRAFSGAPDSHPFGPRTSEATVVERELSLGRPVNCVPGPSHRCNDDNNNNDRRGLEIHEPPLALGEARPESGRAARSSPPKRAGRREHSRLGTLDSTRPAGQAGVRRLERKSCSIRFGRRRRVKRDRHSLARSLAQHQPFSCRALLAPPPAGKRANASASHKRASTVIRVDTFTVSRVDGLELASATGRRHPSHQRGRASQLRGASS
jgi:hypothetical protein